MNDYYWTDSCVHWLEWQVTCISPTKNTKQDQNLSTTTSSVVRQSARQGARLLRSREILTNHSGYFSTPSTTSSFQSPVPLTEDDEPRTNQEWIVLSSTVEYNMTVHFVRDEIIHPANQTEKSNQPSIAVQPTRRYTMYRNMCVLWTKWAFGETKVVSNIFHRLNRSDHWPSTTNKRSHIKIHKPNLAECNLESHPP